MAATMNAPSPIVKINDAVSMSYILKDREGIVIDESQDEIPLTYLHGHKNIVPGLEKALTGASLGETKKVIVSPEEGYGEREDQMLLQVPRSQLPQEMKPEIGMGLTMETENGHTVPVRVSEVHDEHVVLDANHELAGVELHFEVRIESIREATTEEISHGHVHGPGGHNH